MNRLVIGLILGVGLLYLLRGKKGAVSGLGASENPELEKLIDALEFTGKITTTPNARPPNYPQESVGFGIKRWAEAKTPDGQMVWVDIGAAS